MQRKKLFRLIYICLILFLLCACVKPYAVTEERTVASLNAATLAGGSAEHMELSLSDDGAHALMTPTAEGASVTFFRTSTPCQMAILHLAEREHEGIYNLYLSSDGTFSPDRVASGIQYEDGRACCFLIPDGEWTGFRLAADTPIAPTEHLIVEAQHSTHYTVNAVALILLLLALALGILFERKWHIFGECHRFFVKNVCFCKELFTKNRFYFLIHTGFLVTTALYLVLALVDFTLALVSPLYGAVTYLSAALALAFFFADSVAVKKNVHAARLLLATLLLIGSAAVLSSPYASAVSWDDEYHFAFAAYPSALLSGQSLSLADFWIQFHGSTGASFAADPEGTASLLLYGAQTQGRGVLSFLPEGLWETLMESFHPLWLIALVFITPLVLLYFAFQYAVYLPSGFAFWLCRMVRADFLTMLTLGKLAILLTYALVLYFGIKRLKRGASLFAVTALIPAAFFLSLNFTCDAWVTAFILSGLAVFIAALQERKPLSRGEKITMVALIVIGCGPKAIYFIMLFPLLFLPKECFEDKKSRKRFILAVCAVALAVLVSFLLPFLIDMGSKTDIRGGSDVSAGGQIAFILKNPLSYTKILLSFLAEYVAFPNAAAYLSRLGYIGTMGTFLPTLYLGVLLFSALTDRGACDLGKGTLRIRIALLFTAFAALCLVATSLYVGYTPVAHTTVLGCQYRYIFPILPFLLYAVPAPITRRSDTRAALTVGAAALITAFTYFQIYFIKFL